MLELRHVNVNHYSRINTTVKGHNPGFLTVRLMAYLTGIPDVLPLSICHPCPPPIRGSFAQWLRAWSLGAECLALPLSSNVTKGIVFGNLLLQVPHL